MITNSPSGRGPLDASYAPTGTVQFTEVDGEVILMDLGQERFYGLNEVGAALWQGLAAGSPAAEIVARLQEEYEVAPGRLVADAERMIGLFLERDWIAEVPGIAA